MFFNILLFSHNFFDLIRDNISKDKCKVNIIMAVIATLYLMNKLLKNYLIIVNF